MVALALLAGAFMALAELGGSALRNHAYARDLSAATLLARGKLAELEERYEDLGFEDFDETDQGDFADEGRPDVRWQVELARPDADLSAEKLAALFTGGGEGEGDPMALLAGLFGGGAPGEKKEGGGSGPTTSSPAAAMAGQMLQTQLTAFGEQLKKSLRELRLTVTWNDGKPRSFTVTEHLVVLNPRAPGGARGDAPDVPPSTGAAGAAAAAAALTGAGGLPTGGKPTGGPVAPGGQPVANPPPSSVPWAR
jgi:general secretion pathway protein I